jgi:NarL family two-component system sensor histidine kinase LiaS
MGNHVSLTKGHQRLRWKLTLSYTGVTLGALLTVELILLVLVGVGPFLLLNSGALQALLIETASVDYAPTLRSYLAQTPPDQAGIADWLENVGPASSATIPLTFQATDEMLVVGRDGSLLGVKPPDLLRSDLVGQRLDIRTIPGLAHPLQAALAGEEDVDRLYTLARPGDKIVMTIPIWDAAHEQVLGVLVALGEMPTIMTIVGDMAPILGVSLLFFTLVAVLAGTVYGFLAARGPVHRLNRLAEATLAWSQGNFSVSVDDPSGDELGQLARRLNDMARQLQHLLETRRELAVVEERNRLARDLHDSAKQQAFAAAAQVSAARALLERDPEAAETHIDEAERLIHGLRQELTGLVQELSPSALEGGGLAPAVREYSADWPPQSGIVPEVRVQGERSLPLEIEQSVFRIMQEALANVARHSRASSVEIALVYANNAVTLSVTDDGRGFDVGAKRSGFGLSSMQERAEALGGHLTVQSAPGKGTSVSCTVPIGDARGGTP